MKKKIYNFIRRSSIGHRLRIISIITAVIPLLLLGVISSLTYRQDMKRKLTETSYQAIHLLNQLISVETDNYKEYSYQILVSEEVEEILSAQGDERIKNVQGLKWIEDYDFTAYMWTESYEDILLLNREKEVVSSVGRTGISKEYFDIMEKTLKEEQINDCWKSAKTDTGKNIILFMKKVYSQVEKGKHIGYLVFAFDERRMFRDLYSQFSMGGSSVTFVLDENMTYLSSKEQKEKINCNISEEIPKIKGKLSEKGSFTDEYDNRSSLFVYEKNQDLGWYLVTVIDEEYINQDTWKMMKLVMVLVVIALSISLTVAYAVNRTITGPIHNLVLYTQEIEKGNYRNTVLPQEKYTDEMGILTRYCVNMVDKLLWYMQEREEKQNRQRVLEIQNLQYQIQPHFLFNTLNTFKYIAYLNGNSKLSDGISALCSLLRQTITTEKEKVQLHMEIENIKAYVLIQEFRYAGNIKITYDIESECETCLMPRMLLQPLVENSIIHGMKEDILLEIKIKAWAEEGILKIQVCDNGKGFNPEEIKGENKKKQFSGIGMENVRERIDIIYKGKGTFSIKSEREKGTYSFIELPCERETYV